MISAHTEQHNVHKTGWLRAAVLGANDGLISTASIIVGVAAASADKGEILTAGIAGMVAGAMSMAAGEYVSVSSQADAEGADLAREAHELKVNPEPELRELASIYKARGLTPETALEVARQLTAHDALEAHARDELGINEITTARPLQAAWTSAVTFSVGAAAPLAVAALAPIDGFNVVIFLATTVFLGILGALGAQAGGAPLGKGTLRVMFWGIVAMAITAAVGKIFGAVV